MCKTKFHNVYAEWNLKFHFSSKKFNVNFIVKTSFFCIIEMWQEQDISYLMSQIFRNQGVKVQDDTKQIEEVMAKYGAVCKLHCRHFYSHAPRGT